ncbi:MAG: hypothetical protein P8M70_06920 [Verrucomicrobiota bacterium]|nr:hypothetical protein [Verrucomicrobiota bacterium]
MADPQEPQYENPWCPKCKAHSKYVEKQVQRGGERNTYNVTVYDCVDCNKHMYIPREYKLSNQGKAMGCLYVYIPIASIGFLWLGLAMKRAAEKNGSSGEGQMLLFGIIVLGCLGIPAGALIWSAVKYAAWVKWAKERGWEGE